MLGGVALVRTDVSEELSASYLVFLRSVRRLLVTANVVPSSPILVTLMKEALSSSDTSVLTRATRRNIPEDAILQRVGCLCTQDVACRGNRALCAGPLFAVRWPARGEQCGRPDGNTCRARQQNVLWRLAECAGRSANTYAASSYPVPVFRLRCSF
jgi:hypothetical protein